MTVARAVISSVPSIAGPTPPTSAGSTLGGIGLALYMLGWWVQAGASWWVLAAVGLAAALALGGPLFARPKRQSES